MVIKNNEVMLCQTDILSRKNPEMGHVVEFLHFSEEESGLEEAVSCWRSDS